MLIRNVEQQRHQTAESMDSYTFDIEFPDGEILRDTVMASTRHEAEMSVREKHPDAMSMNLIAVN